MTIIELNRSNNSLKIAPTLEDLKELRNTTKIWDVTHVIRSYVNYDFYDVHNGDSIVGYITGVTEVKEIWYETR